MKLIDTHCHLAHDRLHSQVETVLDRARSAGVMACICAAGCPRESQAATALAKKHRDVYCTAGVHPHDAAGAGEDYLQCIESLAAEARNVAIGEIGLDYHYDFSPRNTQRRVFAEQLALARKLGKPVVIHTRDAFDDTLAVLAEADIDPSRAVFHSFTEAQPQVRKALQLGAMISFSGIITFKNASYLSQAARGVPDDRILIETDAPYLCPEPVRKMKTNEPANVVHVATCLAAVRNTSPERLAELTTANAVRFFDLDIDP